MIKWAILKTDEIYTIHTGRLPERDEHNKLLSCLDYSELRIRLSGHYWKREIISLVFRSSSIFVEAKNWWWWLIMVWLFPIWRPSASRPIFLLIVIFHGRACPTDGCWRSIQICTISRLIMPFDNCGRLCETIARQLISHWEPIPIESKSDDTSALLDITSV